MKGHVKCGLECWFVLTQRQVLDTKRPVHHDRVAGGASHDSAFFAFGVKYFSWHLVVCISGKDKSVRLWNPHSGKHIKKFAGCHNQEVNDIRRLTFMRPSDSRVASAVLLVTHLFCQRIAADNSKFVSCGSDKLIFLWDVTSAQAIRKLTGHDRKVNALAFGPKEDVLLSASHDKTVKIWDLRTRARAPIQTLTDAVDSILCLMTHKDVPELQSGPFRLNHVSINYGHASACWLQQCCEQQGDHYGKC